MGKEQQWLTWARKLQAIAQAGLYYGKDDFDRERYQQVRDIAAEMLSAQTELPLETVKGFFCNEVGYQTPKLDTRAAIVQDGKILLVRERNGTWSMPGGWVEPGLSVGENVVKEAREEAGLTVEPERIIAILDRERYSPVVFPYKICKVFIQCRALGGAFVENLETTESGYFSLDELPPLAEEKNTAQQIAMCLEACTSKQWVTVFD
jgi:ADP-ribose pyrophosphatase YjhB (NUDIX family)